MNLSSPTPSPLFRAACLNSERRARTLAADTPCPDIPNAAVCTRHATARPGGDALLPTPCCCRCSGRPPSAHGTHRARSCPRTKRCQEKRGGMQEMTPMARRFRASAVRRRSAQFFVSMQTARSRITSRPPGQPNQALAPFPWKQAEDRQGERLAGEMAWMTLQPPHSTDPLLARRHGRGERSREDFALSDYSSSLFAPGDRARPGRPIPGRGHAAPRAVRCGGSPRTGPAPSPGLPDSRDAK